MPNQYKNKVVYGDSVLMDITDTTAEAGDVASGAVFYAKNGARTVGTFVQAQSDWIEDDNTDPAFILNKPPIIAGDGSYSTVENQIEPNQNADTYTFIISGDASATTFSYTYNGNLPSASNLKSYGLACYSTTKFRAITDIDTTNHTITLSSYISTSAIINGELIIYFRQHLAVGEYSHAEGDCTYAAGKSAHTEGTGTGATGNYSHAEGYTTKAAGGDSHAEGSNSYAKGMASHAEGGSTEAAGSYSHAEGYKTVAKGNYSHAEGFDAVARGDYSHAEGTGAWSYGHYSHAEGAYVSMAVTLSGEANVLTYTIVNSTLSSVDAGAITGSIVNTTATWTYNKPVIQSVTFGEDAIVGKIVTTITLDKTLDSANAVSGTYYILVPNQAIGNYSHVEGIGNFTSGPAQGSHAEGMSVAAMGRVSHAEGISTWTKGQASHTEGTATIAGSENQHVQGKYNIEDSSGVYADIVGNGTSSARSNAYTLDWSGNGIFAGKVTVGAAPTNNMDVATKQYVDTQVSNVPGLRIIKFIVDEDATVDENNPVYTIEGITTAEEYTAFINHCKNGGSVIATDVHDYIFQLADMDLRYENYEFFKFIRIIAYSETSYISETFNISTGMGGIDHYYYETSIPSASSSIPLVDGASAVVGTSTTYARADHVHPKITQSLSISSNVITLTGSDGSTSSITLPVYNGGVQTVS